MYFISIIIPVKNGANTLERCLNSIKSQTIYDRIEIITLYSKSTDNSLDIAKSFGSTIVQIIDGTFNHGLTRNKGVEYAKGELLFYTVQDSFLSEVDQLEKMAAHFINSEVNGVVGMQAIPSEKDKNPARWFKRISIPVTRSLYTFNGSSFKMLPIEEQIKIISPWDNVNAMYRKTALSAVPFKETSFAEDKLWAKDALEAGYNLLFDPSLVIYHYHHQDFKYAFKLRYIIDTTYYKFFNTLPTAPAFFKPMSVAFYRLFKNSSLNLKEKLYWCCHNLVSNAGSSLSYFVFMSTLKLFGKQALIRSLEIFCNEVPQGRVK